MEDVVNETLKQVLIGLAGAAITGLATWAGLALRRAAKNVGRTELQLAIDELNEAVEEEKAAAKTPGLDDDALAAKHKAAAKKRVEKSKRLKALLDAAGEEPPEPSTPASPGGAT